MRHTTIALAAALGCVALSLFGCPTQPSPPPDWLGGNPPPAASPGSPGTEEASVFTDHAWNAMFDAVRGGAWDAARGHMVSLYRAEHDVAAFRAAIEANPLVARHTASSTNSFGACEGMEGGSCAMGWLQTPIGKVQFTVAYTSEEGEDRVIALSVAGVPVVGVGVPSPAPPPSPVPAEPSR